LKFPTHFHIRKHFGNLVHGVDTTLDLEFLEHFLLGFLGEESLVEEAGSQELGVGFDEDIASVQAAEKPHDGAQSGVNLLLGSSLKALLQFNITILGNVSRGLSTLVHKLHEGRVTGLLEFHILGERKLDHVIHLSLEGQQLAGKFEGISKQSLVSDDLLATAADVGVHLVNDVTLRVTFGVLVSLKDRVTKLQLIKSRMEEHEMATCLFFRDSFGLACYAVFDDDVETLRLALGFEPDVSVLLFSFKAAFDQAEVLRAVERGYSALSFLYVISIGRVKELLLKIFPVGL